MAAQSEAFTATAASSSASGQGLRHRSSSPRGPSPDSVRSDALSHHRSPVMSSRVAFYPPSDTLWRIGGKWYDLNPFLKLHPGGAEVVQLARDRFEDATYAFEAHHHNYQRARAIIAKYEVPAPSSLHQRPLGPVVPGAGGDGSVPKLPELLDDEAFYSVVRRRLTEHLRKVGCSSGGPTRECVVAFWANFVAFCTSWALMFYTGSILAALAFGVTASLLGAFGHNWVHQPRYRIWSYLSLDTIGFSSTGWFREHVLQHHMYTNTPWDNHFRGTDPFLVSDPTIHRHWIQQYIMPYINPIILTFGLFANYLAHAVDMLKGDEEWRVTKAILPLNVSLVIWRWGLIHGVLLTYSWAGMLGMHTHLDSQRTHTRQTVLTSASRARARALTLAVCGLRLGIGSCARPMVLHDGTDEPQRSTLPRCGCTQQSTRLGRGPALFVSRLGREPTLPQGMDIFVAQLPHRPSPFPSSRLFAPPGRSGHRDEHVPRVRDQVRGGRVTGPHLQRDDP